MTENRGDAAIVHSTIPLGREVVAEGVETGCGARAARGVRLRQRPGYLISRPLAAPQLETWVAERASRRQEARPEAARFAVSLRLPMGTGDKRQQPGHHALLSEITALLTGRELPVWELLETAAKRLSDYFGDTFIVSLLSDDGRHLHPLGLADPDPEVGAVLDSLTGVRFRADRGFSRHVLSGLTSVLLAETSSEVIAVGRPELAAYAERFGIFSGVLAPMRVHGGAVGHVAGLRRRAADPYTATDEALVQSVADWLALAVQCSGPQSPATAAVSRGDEGRVPLSAREREILILIALGHTNREVAEQLVLSVRTVEWHRARIQWKLGVTGRAALAAAARSHGLLE